MERRLCIGLDFGTDSVRAVLVDSSDGTNLATSIAHYERWARGAFCDPTKDQFRQHPDDHFYALTLAVTTVMQTPGVDASEVKAMCVDATGSSPVPVDETGTPLALLPEFEDNPDAMVILWKDHTAIAEADEINRLARSWGGVDYTRFSGGIYSSEWFWAKILRVVRRTPEVAQAAFTWLEHCDLLTFTLINEPEVGKLKRSRCAAGHKGMWHASWDGYPSVNFLERLDPQLSQLRETLPDITYTSDQVAGTLSTEWADRLGLTTNVVVAVGVLDAHAGAVGAAIQPKTLVRVMGTSTCDMIIAPPERIGERTVSGISGQVDGSILPGSIGFEAGQSAFGDVLDWYRQLLLWPLNNIPPVNNSIAGYHEQVADTLLHALTVAAEALPLAETQVLSLDWINGRRSPDANQKLKGAITNLSLGASAPVIYKSLVEAICFGSRAILERFREEGVEIDEITGIGGVANKSSYIMQTLASILGVPIKVVTSEQTGGLGAAMLAATAAKIYPRVEQAIKHMGQGFKQTYYPNEDHRQHYNRLYRDYLALGEYVESSVINKP